MASSNLMVGLEIGTSKICVVVGESRPDGTIKILGVGQAPSRGVRKGEIVDFETAMKCVHEAVVDAEEKSDVMIRSVYIGDHRRAHPELQQSRLRRAARGSRRDRRTGYRGREGERARGQHPGAERVSAHDHPALSRRRTGRRAQSARHARAKTGGRFSHHPRRAHADSKHHPLREGIAARSRGRRLHRARLRAGRAHAEPEKSRRARDRYRRRHDRLHALCRRRGETERRARGRRRSHHERHLDGPAHPDDARGKIEDRGRQRRRSAIVSRAKPSC